MKVKGCKRTLAISVTVNLLILCFLYIESNGDPPLSPCSESLPEPEQPFRVVWNHPNFCDKVNYSKYGIFYNSNRRFLGDKVQTFYSTGEWPTLDYYGNFIKGGLPQLFNETDFNETRRAFSIARTDDFDGLAVIDWESWRPTFFHNFGSYTKYKDASIKLVRDHNPGITLTNNQVEEVAKEAWEAGAKRIFLAKLKIGKELMPKGYWGFYLFPSKWASDTNNNRLSWLWREVTGLYPSMYMWDQNQSTQQKINRVWGQVYEGIRIQAAFAQPNTPVYAFSNNQNYENDFFNQDHFNVSIGMVARMGASGVVIWGSSSFYHNSRVCDRLQAQMDNVLGPYVLDLTTFLDGCSKRLCNGHGRCVHNAEDTLISLQEAVILSRQCTTVVPEYSDYHCRCYAFWKAPCCQSPSCDMRAVGGAGKIDIHRSVSGAGSSTETPAIVTIVVLTIFAFYGVTA